MTREEIDTAWSRALGEAVKEGEQYTRYHFAAIIRAQALEDAQKVADELSGFLIGHCDQEGAEIALSVRDSIRSLKGKP